jgi:hypothetical protein
MRKLLTAAIAALLATSLWGTALSAAETPACCKEQKACCQDGKACCPKDEEPTGN